MYASYLVVTCDAVHPIKEIQTIKTSWRVFKFRPYRDHGNVVVLTTVRPTPGPLTFNQLGKPNRINSIGYCCHSHKEFIGGRDCRNYLISNYSININKKTQLYVRSFFRLFWLIHQLGFVLFANHYFQWWLLHLLSCLGFQYRVCIHYC